MGEIDYTKLTEITVKSQKELDMIPDDFNGRIYIEFGTPWNKAVVSKRYKRSVVARENSSVVAMGNSSVVAMGNSSVVARENSSVEAMGNSSVEARENSSVVARGNSSVEARGNSSVVARENSSVVAMGNSSVVARENSSVVAMENSSVEAMGNSSVVARENSSVEAMGNVQVVDCLCGGRIEITGNARIVYMPKTIEEYCTFYGIEHDKKKGKFFKCVHHLKNGAYVSDNDNSFCYVIGEKAIADYLDTDENEDCGHGIHVAYLQWVLDYGRNWGDLAILELEIDLDSVVVPKGYCGKVRCAEAHVLREVPLEECGLYGKILASRKK